MEIPKGRKRKPKADFELLAKEFKHKSARAMFDKLYGDSPAELRAGKMSVVKLAKYLGIATKPLQKILRKYGYPISPAYVKVKYAIRSKRKVRYPYRRMGFVVEFDMWEFFIEKNIKVKEILCILTEVTGRYFLYRIVLNHLIWAKKEYKKRMDENKT